MNTITTFNKRKDKMLIGIVKNYPVLYDPGDPNFKNCIAKHKIWESVSESMNISIPMLKKRWKHFRDHYQKKLRLENAGIKTLHTWEYADDMSFFAEYFSPKEAKKDESDQDETEELNIFYTADENIPVRTVLEDQNINSDEEDEPLRKKHRKVETIAAVVESRLARRLGFDERPRSATHKFFEAMADIVVDFPPHLAAEVRLRVCQLVNECEEKKNVKIESDFLV